MKVLVCGGRTYGELPRVNHPDYHRLYAKAVAERQRVREVLDAVLAKHGMFTLIHGGAKGADRLAGLWGEALLEKVIPCPADWEREGRRAGLLRNQQMLDEHKPDAVIAFPGGRGTAHMVRIAKAAGVPVWEIDADDGA